jgi:hypothetical protein
MEHDFVITASPNQHTSDPRATMNYVGRCQTCGWRGEVWHSYTEAEDEAVKHAGNRVAWVARIGSGDHHRCASSLVLARRARDGSSQGSGRLAKDLPTFGRPVSRCWTRTACTSGQTGLSEAPSGGDTSW